MKVCMVVYTYYENDTRVRMYAETLAQRGDWVDVLALKTDIQDDNEIINGVNLFRIQKRVINERSKLTYLYRLLKFFVKSSYFLARKNLINSYDLIHIHSVPDFEVFAALIPKLFGSKIILDIHDIVPEFYASKFNVNHNSLIFKILLFVERLSSTFADHVIIANHIWEKTLTARSVNKNKCTAILNYPNPSFFYKRPRTRDNGKVIILYPGTLNWHQGVDIAIRSFSLIKDQAPNTEFHIYGEGSTKTSLIDLVSQFGLQDKVFISGFLSIEKIVDIMANADIGVVPKRNDSFGGEAFSTKIFEFMALGVPIIVAKTKVDDYYFNDSVVKFFKPDDEIDLAQCMLTLINDENLRKQLAGNALQFVEDFKWDTKKAEYLNLVDSLVGNSNTTRIHK